MSKVQHLDLKKQNKDKVALDKSIFAVSSFEDPS